MPRKQHSSFAVEADAAGHLRKFQVRKTSGCAVAALLFLPLAAVASDESSAIGPNTDWKYFGGAPPDSFGENSCFYEASGVVSRPDNRIRVWTKCLRQSELDNLDTQLDATRDLIIRIVASKIAEYYVPPFATITSLDVNQEMTITLWESVATVANSQPVVQIFHEIDCRERKARALHVFMHTLDGSETSSSAPGNWRYVAPEGNDETLIRLLCPPT